MNIITKLLQLVSTLLYTKFKFINLFNKCFSINTSRLVHNIASECGTNLSTIIDVGANQGQFAFASRLYFPSAIIHSFEPVPSTFEVLSKNTKNIKGLNLYNFALGNKLGDIDFFQNNYSHASSALPISAIQTKIVPHTLDSKSIKVSISTLKHFFQGNANLPTPILLKLDVQGFEKEVLLGGVDILHKIDFLLVETSFDILYEGEPLFNEMHEFITGLGFILIRPVSFWQTNDLQIRQMDMLYGRK